MAQVANERVDQLQDALDQLASMLQKVDGNPSPGDWMVNGADKDEVRTEIELLISLITYLL